MKFWAKKSSQPHLSLSLTLKSLTLYYENKIRIGEALCNYVNGLIFNHIEHWSACSGARSCRSAAI